MPDFFLSQKIHVLITHSFSSRLFRAVLVKCTSATSSRNSGGSGPHRWPLCTCHHWALTWDSTDNEEKNVLKTSFQSQIRRQTLMQPLKLLSIGIISLQQAEALAETVPLAGCLLPDSTALGSQRDGRSGSRPGLLPGPAGLSYRNHAGAGTTISKPYSSQPRLSTLYILAIWAAQMCKNVFKMDRGPYWPNIYGESILI